MKTINIIKDKILRVCHGMVHTLSEKWVQVEVKDAVLLFSRPLSL